MAYIPKAGDFGLSIIEGRTGALVNLGQAILRDSAEFTHAFIILDDGNVLEAMPGGARITSLKDYVESDRKIMFARWPLSDENRRAIVHVARAMEGTGYSFGTYLYLALRRLGWDSAWLRKKIKSRGKQICSQLVDFVYQAAGVHLFNDGRANSFVTPGDLNRLLIDNDLYYIKPGKSNKDY